MSGPAKRQIEFKARPISHWQFATLMEVRSGAAGRRARQAKTTTLRLLNAQTLSSLFYRGYLDCDSKEEPWITELGEQVVIHMTGDGRYRDQPGEIVGRVLSYLSKSRRPPKLVPIRGRAVA